MTDRDKIIDILNKNFTQVECTPVYTTTDGKEIALPQELCNIFNDIVTQAVVPYFADALITAGLKFDAIPEWEYQRYCAYKIIEPQIKDCFDRERALKGQLAVVYRALLNMTKKYCVAERKTATTKDGWFSRGETQLALLAAEAIRDAEKELAEEAKENDKKKKI